MCYRLFLLSMTPDLSDDNEVIYEFNIVNNHMTIYPEFYFTPSKNRSNLYYDDKCLD